MPTEDQRAICVNCGRPIAWFSDLDEDDQITPYGFWYDAERDTEVCGGPDPTVALDDDLWHEPVVR